MFLSNYFLFYTFEHLKQINVNKYNIYIKNKIKYLVRVSKTSHTTHNSEYIVVNSVYIKSSTITVA